MLDYIFYIIIYLLKICLILHMLEKIEWTISNGHSKDTGNTGHTRHRTKSSKTSSTTTTTAKQNKTNKQTNKQNKTKNKTKQKSFAFRAKGKQFLLHIRHRCYSYIQPSPIKILSVIKERKQNLLKRKKIQCYLRYGQFVVVKQIVMTTVSFYKDIYTLAIEILPTVPTSCVQNVTIQLISGDEYHYILVCQHFSNFRNRFIITIYECYSKLQSKIQSNYVNSYEI